MSKKKAGDREVYRGAASQKLSNNAQSGIQECQKTILIAGRIEVGKLPTFVQRFVKRTGERKENGLCGRRPDQSGGAGGLIVDKTRKFVCNSTLLCDPSEVYSNVSSNLA